MKESLKEFIDQQTGAGESSFYYDARTTITNRFGTLLLGSEQRLKNKLKNSLKPKRAPAGN